MLVKIIGVGAIDEGIEPTLPNNGAESGPELVLAEVAAVGRVAQVALVLELIGVHHQHGNVEASASCSAARDCAAGYDALRPVTARNRAGPSAFRAATASRPESTPRSNPSTTLPSCERCSCRIVSSRMVSNVTGKKRER